MSGAAVAVAAALLAAIPNAHAGAAPKAVTIEAIVILASQTDGGVDDPRIASIAELKRTPTNKSPLTFFSTRRPLDKPQVRAEVGTDATAASKFLFTFALEAGKPVALAVKDGPTLSLTLGDVVLPDGGPPHYNINAVLKSGSSSSTILLTLFGSQRAFLGGPSYGAGTLFFGFRAKS